MTKAEAEKMIDEMLLCQRLLCCSRFEKKQKERRLQKNVEMANTSVQLIKDSQFDMSVFKEQLSKMLEDDSKMSALTRCAECGPVTIIQVMTNQNTAPRTTDQSHCDNNTGTTGDRQDNDCGSSGAEQCGQW